MNDGANMKVSKSTARTLTSHFLGLGFSREAGGFRRTPQAAPVAKPETRGAAGRWDHVLRATLRSAGLTPGKSARIAGVPVRLNVPAAKLAMLPDYGTPESRERSRKALETAGWRVLPFETAAVWNADWRRSFAVNVACLAGK